MTLNRQDHSDWGIRLSLIISTCIKIWEREEEKRRTSELMHTAYRGGRKDFQKSAFDHTHHDLRSHGPRRSGLESTNTMHHLALQIINNESRTRLPLHSFCRCDWGWLASLCVTLRAVLKLASHARRGLEGYQLLMMVWPVALDGRSRPIPIWQRTCHCIATWFRKMNLLNKDT